MSSGETIRLLTQHFVRPMHDPGENRLTAALVALLSQSDVLARRVLKAWVPKASDGGPIKVCMHRAVGSPGGHHVGWVDLEILTGDRLRPSVIVWIEVKLGSRLSGPNQLAKYLAGLRAAYPGARKLVVLLAPAHRRSAFNLMPLSSVIDPRPDEAYFVSLQDLYGEIARPLGQQGNRHHFTWLRREVLGYMESEGISKPARLSKSHVQTLNRIDPAEDAVEVVLDEAAQLVAKRWRASNKTQLEKNYWEYRYLPYRQGAVRKGWRRTSEFGWGVQPPQIFAGVYFDRTKGPIVGNDLWLADREAENDPGADAWEIDAEGRRGWVMRTMPLMDLANASTVNDQAKVIADFVLRAFEDLSKSAEPDKKHQ